MLKTKELIFFVRNGIQQLKNSAKKTLKSETNGLQLRKIFSTYVIIANAQLEEKNESNSGASLENFGSVSSKEMKSPLKRKFTTRKLKKAFSSNLEVPSVFKPVKRTSMLLVTQLLSISTEKMQKW